MCVRLYDIYIHIYVCLYVTYTSSNAEVTVESRVKHLKLSVH